MYRFLERADRHLRLGRLVAAGFAFDCLRGSCFRVTEPFDPVPRPLPRFLPVDC